MESDRGEQPHSLSSSRVVECPAIRVRLSRNLFAVTLQLGQADTNQCRRFFTGLRKLLGGRHFRCARIAPAHPLLKGTTQKKTIENGGV